MATLIPDPRILPDNANLPTINQPAAIVGITVAVLTIAITAASLRIWIRLRDKLWGWDDVFVVCACCTSLVGDTMVCLMPQDGLGLHLWTLDHIHLESFFRRIYNTNVTYCMSATFIKLSILYQYLRLFAETAPSTNCPRYRLARQLTWSLIVLSALWGTIFLILSTFSCSPIAKYWNVLLPGRCIGWGTKDPNEFFRMFLGHAVSNSVLDLLVLLLPMPFLAMLRLSSKSKAGLISLFALGSLVAVVALGRMITLSINRAGTIPVIDMSYYTPIVYIFGVLEVNIAILAASIPTFWPVIANFASNKIFVVNEIEIHVESAPRDSFSSGNAIVCEGKNAYGGQQSNLNVITKTISASDDRSHKRFKPSNTSSASRSIGMDLGSRPSQDSQRKLYRTPSGANRSSSSMSRREGNDWFMELNQANSIDNTTTTVVDRTGIPLEPMKTFSK